MKQFISFAALLAIVISTATGCIRTRITVLSEPPGATVVMNKETYGNTPIEIMTTWYWEYEFQLDKEGYQTLIAREQLKAKFWQHFPIDIFAEIIPIPFLDERTLLYNLEPEAPKDDLEQLLEL